jgi:hypothetical protein
MNVSNIVLGDRMALRSILKARKQLQKLAIYENRPPRDHAASRKGLALIRSGD